jgi:hypothetical protein
MSLQSQQERSKNEEIVNDIIQCHKPFSNLKLLLVENIKTLTEEFIRGPVIKSTLLLLTSCKLIGLYQSTIDKLETEPTLPRSLRVKIELTCSEKCNNDANEFQTLKDNAKNLTDNWQNAMKDLFIQTKKLDMKHAQQKHRDYFYAESIRILDHITCYGINLMKDDNNTKIELLN